MRAGAFSFARQASNPRSTSTLKGWLARARDHAQISRQMAVLRPDLVFAAVALNLMGLALPLAMLQIFDRIIPHRAFNTLGLLVLGLVITFILEAFLRQARATIIAWEGARFEHRMARMMVETYLNAPAILVEKKAIGAHLDSLNAVDPVRDFYGNSASFLLVDVPFLLIFLGLIAFIGGWLVLVPISLIVLFGFLAWLTGQALHNVHRMRKHVDDRRYNFIVEVLGNIHTVKGLAMEGVIERRHERLVEQSAALGWRNNYLSSMSESLISAFSQVSTIAVAGAGAFLVIRGDISTGALAASTLLAGRAVQPLLRTLGLWTRFQSVRLSNAQLQTVLSMPSENAAQRQAAPAIDTIELQSVTFGFQSDDDPDAASASNLFEDLSLSVARGQITAISGPNGSGKSTLLWMLMGGIEPQSGRILINGQDISQFDRRSLRQQIAYVPQRAVLFKGTVLDNLTNFDIDRNMETALELAHALGLDQYFAAIPEGYQLDVGNGGLPSGVIQRIAMVRALVNRPQVILFDEANANLDQTGDRLVIELLKKYRQDTALVMVSFRPSVLALADQHWHLHAKRLQRVASVQTHKGAPA